MAGEDATVIAPGAYHFNPHDNSTPLLAIIQNTKRRRWRVRFYRFDNGAEVRLGRTRAAPIPLVTVDAAMGLGRLVPLVPDYGRRDVDVGPVIGRNALPGMAINGHSAIRQLAGDDRDERNGFGERHGTDALLRDGAQPWRRE